MDIYYGNKQGEKLPHCVVAMVYPHRARSTTKSFVGIKHIGYSTCAV